MKIQLILLSVVVIVVHGRIVQKRESDTKGKAFKNISF